MTSTNTKLSDVAGSPVAWLHILDNTDGIEENKPCRELTFTEDSPFGVAGVDYSAEYPITSTPLYFQANAEIEDEAL